MIHELQKIGLSELEARCYLTLHETPNISGYEVAKKVSVSRTNVYAALRSLTDKGVCRVMEAKPPLYSAVPIGELIRFYQSEFEHTSKVLKENLQDPPTKPASFYTWQGKGSVETAFQRLVANAEKTIVVDLWAEDLPLFEPFLKDAESRNVDVQVILIGERYTELRHVLIHKRNKPYNEPVRRFSLVIDGQSVLIGGFGKSIKISALETNHPSIVSLLKVGFYHDVVMNQIEQDFGKELADKYGEGYEGIVKEYKKYL
ncbi:TrmB family transcriptional regulator [Camelliibacillus cellulosilyticus]|uniref:TrmB family transcriptional regulator n=1 Tax=Camelliibacillus cellulosilyticus TaxID=2174486 RepID=A0ABV9GLD6_9BACL